MSQHGPDAPILNAAVLAGLRELQEPGAPDVVDEVITLFFGDNARRLIAIDAAAARGDARHVADVAHQIRGSASLIGADRVAQIASEIEQHAKADRLQHVGDLLQHLATAVEQTKAAADRLAGR